MKFKNLSFLAFILGILSVVGTITVGFAFLRCYIALAVGSIFAAASVLTEHFALSKYIFTLKSQQTDEIKFDKLKALKAVTRYVIMTSCACISGVLFSIAGCIDADSYSYNTWYVRNPLVWLFIAIVCVIASLIISAVIKNLTIFSDDEAVKRYKEKVKKFFVGFIIVMLTVTLAVAGIDFAVNKIFNKSVYKFDNKTQFDAFIKFNYEDGYVLYKTDYEALEAYVFSKGSLPYAVNIDSSIQFDVDFDTEAVSVPYISSYVYYDFYEEYQSDIDMDVVVFDTKEALDKFVNDNDFIPAEDLRGPLSVLINAISYNEQELEVTYKLNYGSSLNIFSFVIIYVPVTIIYFVCFEFIWRRREKFNNK